MEQNMICNNCNININNTNIKISYNFDSKLKITIINFLPQTLNQQKEFSKCTDQCLLVERKFRKDEFKQFIRETFQTVVQDKDDNTILIFSRIDDEKTLLPLIKKFCY